MGPAYQGEFKSEVKKEKHAVHWPHWSVTAAKLAIGKKSIIAL